MSVVSSFRRLGRVFRSATNVRKMETTMTKAKELEVLDQTIEKLGEDSYLGPWLKQVKFEVEQMVRSDIFPTVNLTESARQAQEIKDEALAMSVKMVQQAADRVIESDKKIEKYRNDYLNSAYDALNRAQRALSDI